MTVWIVQKPKMGPNTITYDISPAQEYGTVEFIFDAYENPSSNPAAALQKARDVLQNFNSRTDYVVSAGGDPFGLLLVGFVVGEMELPIRWLRFERLRVRPGMPVDPAAKTGYYVPLEMPISAY